MGSAAASLALLVAGCVSSPAASAHDSATTALTLTVSDQLADFQPLLEASGLFSGLSYHLDFSVLNGSAALLSALESDKIDVGAAGDNSAAFEVANESQTPTRSLLAYQGPPPRRS